MKTVKVNIILVLFISAFAACKNHDIDVIYEITAKKDIPTFIVEELETYYSDSGKVQVKIYAPEMIRIEKTKNSYDEYPKGINVDFYDNMMNVSATLTGEYAIFHIEKEIWEVRDNVVAKNVAEDESLSTEVLYWNINTERIYSDKFVRIKTDNEVLFGRGFESNQDFSQWRILEPTGTILIEDEE